jgi:hypothetical protein
VLARTSVSGDPARTQPPSRRPATRIEYLDGHADTDYREYRFAVHSPEGPVEVRVRIPLAAFAASRVLLQDGPDVSYQRLLRMHSDGQAPSGVVTIDTAELAAYREARTPAPRRSVTPASNPARPPTTRAPAPQTHPKLPVAAAPPPAEVEPAFDEGLRVSHEVFGAGVTMASSGGRTSVQFDDHGVKSFVTSLLKLELLSAPHEWEAGPRGKNRRRDGAVPDPDTRKRRA